MRYSISTPPTVEPVTLTAAKLHLRVTHNAEDALIAALIVAAREYCEGVTRRALATQTLEAYMARWPARSYMELPRPPLQSVTSVKYTDSTGAEHTLTDYIVDTNSGRVWLSDGGSWPGETLAPVNPIKVRYVAGYTNAPESLKQAMLLLIGHWFLNREATGEVAGPLAFAVSALLSLYRARWY